MMFRLMAGCDDEGVRWSPRWAVACDVRWCNRGQRFQRGPRALRIAEARDYGWLIVGPGLWCVCPRCAELLRQGGACETEPKRHFTDHTALIHEGRGSHPLYPPAYVKPYLRRVGAAAVIGDGLVMRLDGERLTLTPSEVA